MENQYDRYLVRVIPDFINRAITNELKKVAAL